LIDRFDSIGIAAVFPFSDQPIVSMLAVYVAKIHGITIGYGWKTRVKVVYVYDLV
jgi:hypothetical protein